jgi:hypothetical protein
MDMMARVNPWTCRADIGSMMKTCGIRASHLLRKNTLVMWRRAHLLIY